MDPNNPDNDISGGSREAPLIAKLFSEAHATLRDHMARLNRTGNLLRQGQSILGPIFGGNYTSFILQRDRLRNVHNHLPPHARG